MRLAQLALLVSLATACGTPPPPPDISPDAPALDPGFQVLVSTPWSLDANAEQYYCLRVTLQQDIWIKSINPIAPTGTHHSVLMISSNPTVADGLTECSSELSEPAIYASGVGTNELDFPDGIGLHLKAGDQLFLNLHLFNTSGVPLTGTSGIQYMAADPTTIVHEAGTVLAGKAVGATVPVGENVQLQFTCTTPADTVMFAVAPHMHLYGTHLNAIYTPTVGGAATTILDTDYQFDDQQFHLIPPMTTVADGKYQVTCTYTNESGSPVPFGESTTQEMCFAMTYVYPPPPAAVCSK
jgi:hypothetical protein